MEKAIFFIWVAILLPVLQIEGQFARDGKAFVQQLAEHFNEISDGNFLKHLRKFTQKTQAKLGQMCFDSSDCSSIGPGVQCSRDHLCECDKHHIQVNNSKCLPGVLLGFSCEDSLQCDAKVPHSICVQGYCRCEIGFTPFRRANCIQGSDLGSTCRTDAQCGIRTANSECRWIVRRVLGHCQCQKGMPRRGNECGTPGYALGAPCGKSLECSSNVPGSICVELTEEVLNQEAPVGLKVNGISTRQKVTKVSSLVRQNFMLKDPFGEGVAPPHYGGICLCPKGHLAVENNTKCVPIQKDASEPSVSLGKPCRTDVQCQTSDPFSVCRDNICICAESSSECSPQNTGCFDGTFQCVSDGKCISADYVCNGQRECKDGSDEEDCIPWHCSHLAFTCNDGSCLSRGKVCDANQDCKDGSDEMDCFETCPSSTFRCGDGQCLPGYCFCNAHYDCIDKSDEMDEPCIQGALHVPECPFRCKNQRCRSRSILCSGIDGCGDRSDEERCSVCNCPRPEG